MFIHIVLFWLKKGTPDSARKQFLEEVHSLLEGIPTVRHIWAGRPAETPRDIVDNSYDIGLCVVLDDSKAHDAYQDHPRHKQFIANNGANWDRLQVYDFT